MSAPLSMSRSDNASLPVYIHSDLELLGANIVKQPAFKCVSEVIQLFFYSSLLKV